MSSLPAQRPAASCRMRPLVTSRPGMLPWSRTPRVEQTPPPRCEAERPAGSGTARLGRGGCRFCFAGESGTDMLGAVMCAQSRGSWWSLCHSQPQRQTDPAGALPLGQSQNVGTAEPRRDSGTEPLPKTQPAASLGLASLPVFAPWRCPHDPRFGFSFIETASASVCRNHKLRLP